MTLNEGSMRSVLLSFKYTLEEDETLLRLLYYPPVDEAGNALNPLDKTLPNILEMEEHKTYEIIQERIKTIQKSSNLEDKQLCRIYLYAGKRRPTYKNNHFAYQDIIIDVFVHESYEIDFRLAWISDRLNHLLVRERIAGIGKVDYAAGVPFQAPREYIRMKHTYRISVDKKWQ